MDIQDINWLGFKAAGTLFWTMDSHGDFWVLLARRRENSILGRIYSYVIPTVMVSENEDLRSAAARAAHNELGLMPSDGKMEEFWSIEHDGISMALYSQYVSSRKNPKCHGSYCDGSWFCLPDDCHIEDGDYLLFAELKAFLAKQKAKKAVG